MNDARRLLLLFMTLLLQTTHARGDVEEQSFAVHGQFTYVEQETSDFNAPYRGANSLSPSSGAETTDLSLYLGARLWRGAEAWINPELDQGRGLDNTLGAAGFPSGEAYKIGKSQPYLRVPRIFVRQTLDLDGAAQSIDADLFQLGGTRSADRVVITLGKFSVGDVFDANDYAHDPRKDFLNWSAIDAGSFDYAADAWGYTVGAAAEWYQGDWTLRGGVFDLSNVPNSAHLEPAFHEFQTELEIERRYTIGGAPGSVRLTGFQSRGRMGLLDAAVAASQQSGNPVDIAAVRRYRSRLGASVNVQQQINASLGWFLRAGKAAGNVEAYEFTDIDAAVSTGLSLKGAAWHRAQDRFALAAMRNAISPARQRYLDAGGLGILVGDGTLPHYGPEQILETYYSFDVFGYAQLSLDYQWLNHPAYNRDRGPASVYAIRLHAQF